MVCPAITDTQSGVSSPPFGVDLWEVQAKCVDRSISRKHSLRPLKITKESFCKILTRHKVKASFLDLVFGFRAADELSEKGYGLRTAQMNELGQYGMHATSYAHFINLRVS